MSPGLLLVAYSDWLDSLVTLYSYPFLSWKKRVSCLGQSSGNSLAQKVGLGASWLVSCHCEQLARTPQGKDRANMHLSLCLFLWVPGYPSSLTQASIALELLQLGVRGATILIAFILMAFPGSFSNPCMSCKDTWCRDSEQQKERHASHPFHQAQQSPPPSQELGCFLCLEHLSPSFPWVFLKVYLVEYSDRHL